MLELRPYQNEAIEAVAEARERGRRAVIVTLPTGCHRAGQGILLHDGGVKAVEEILPGDRLMGPDSRPRRVIQLARGRGQMVEVRPTKGDPWVVNDEHILTLVRTNARNSQPHRNAGRVYPSELGGELVDVGVDEWRGWSATAKHLHKLQRFAVDFPRRPPTALHPYLLGALLGDGGLTQNGRVLLTNVDAEVIEACRAAAKDHGLRLTRLRCDPITYSIGGETGRSANHVMSALRSHGLLPIACADRFIPNAYKTGSRDERRELLAGLIDTDGSARDGGYEFCSKARRLAADVAFVARSLGLAAYVTERTIKTNVGGGTYQRVSISGDCAIVPCRISRKQHAVRCQVKDVLRTGFAIEPTGTEEDYYGFTLDGDGRYLLDDFTVTHNTGKTVVFSEMIKRQLQRGPALVLAHRDELITQAAGKVAAIAPELRWQIGIVKGSQKQIGYSVVVASVQTLSRRATLQRAHDALQRFRLIVVDECHHAAADSYVRILEQAHPDCLIVGFTATAKRHDKRKLRSVFEEIVYARSIEEMVREGYLAPPVGKRIEAGELNLGDVKQSRGDFQAADLGRAMHDAGTVDDVLQAFEEHAATRKAVLFAPTVAIAREMADAFREAGYKAADVNGKTEMGQRRRILRDFATDKLQLVANVGVLTEGFDDPSIDCVMIARPTKSEIMYTQMIGRGLRLHPGKEDCLVLDLAGASDELTIQGLPEIFGLETELRDGETVIDALDREVTEREARDAEQAKRVSEQAEAQKRQRSRRAQRHSKIGFFARDRLHWLELDGRWILDAGAEEGEDGKRGENVLLVLRENLDGSWWVLLLEEHNAKVVQRGLDLGYAQGVAEEVLRAREVIGLNDKHARWRRQEVSKGQRGYLWHLGIRGVDPATKGEAADLITLALAEARLRRFDAALAKREAAQTGDEAAANRRRVREAA